MQERKSKVVSSALGDDNRKSGIFSIEELIRLFGRVGEDEHGQPFIWADSDTELDPQGEAGERPART